MVPHVIIYNIKFPGDLSHTSKFERLNTQTGRRFVSLQFFLSIRSYTEKKQLTGKSFCHAEMGLNYKILDGEKCITEYRNGL
jgi:hypothetical protein